MGPWIRALIQQFCDSPLVVPMPIKFPLRHASKRASLTPRSVMIRIRYHGADISCDNPKEAQEILRYIEKQENAKQAPAGSLAALIKGGSIADMLLASGTKNPWTGESFWAFIESLGTQQEKVLRLLLRKRKISDDDLRKALGLETNQQLAGVLSGISKQAAAQGIPARAAFTIENESKSGEVTKTYAVASEFVATSNENNWPNT